MVEDKRLNIPTPSGKNISVGIVEPVKRKILLKDSLKLDFSIPTIFGNMNVYHLPQNEFLVDYTNDVYSLRISNLDDLKELFQNENHNYITLVYDKRSGEYHPSFALHSEIINLIIKGKQNEVIEGFGRTYHFDPYNRNAVTHSIVIQLENKAVLTYFERSPGVFQGVWFPDFKNFKYYYDNDLC